MEQCHQVGKKEWDLEDSRRVALDMNKNNSSGVTGRKAERGRMDTDMRLDVVAVLCANSFSCSSIF